MPGQIRCWAPTTRWKPFVRIFSMTAAMFYLSLSQVGVEREGMFTLRSGERQRVGVSSETFGLEAFEFCPPTRKADRASWPVRRQAAAGAASRCMSWKGMAFTKR